MHSFFTRLQHTFSDHVLKRGERLEDVMNKAEDLAQEADHFRRGAVKLKNAMRCKIIRLTIILIVVVLTIVAIIIFSVCGINFTSCGNNSPPPIANTPG